MGALLNFSINLDKLDKSKVIKGAKGNYYDLTVSINDKSSQYGNNVSVFDSQTKEQREAKAEKNYVANGKVIWTDGNIYVAEKSEQTQQAQAATADIDLPF